VSELCTTSNHFDGIFDSELLIDGEVDELSIFRKHTKVIILIHLTVIVDQVDGKDNDD